MLLVQLVLKEAVGRRLGDGLSFPSGHVAAATVIVCALVLAFPGPLSIVVAILGGLLVLMTSVAVVSLGWHFPTDVFAGWAIGIGGVTVIDGLLKLG